MDYYIQLLTYVIASFFTEVVILYIACKLLNKKIEIKRILLIGLVVDLILAPIIFILSTHFISQLLVAFFADYICMFINCIAIYLFIEKNGWKAFIAGSFAYFIYYQSYVLSLFLLPTDYALGNAINQTISIITLYIITYFTGKLIKKMQVSVFINKCASHVTYRYFALLLCLFLTGYTGYMALIVALLMNSQAILGFFSLIILIIVIGMIEFSCKKTILQEAEKHQQTIITQQQDYIESLEDIQKEVRIYRHDYKNMMSGMYLKAQEGNFDDVQSFMQDMFEGFEMSIGNKIYLTNQLSNIYIIELKSLLMHKIMSMQKQSISFHLEVLYPINQIAMDIQDLNRCIGILLDNAIEAVTSTEGSIDIIITAIDNEASFLIENSIPQEIPLSKINQEGFSTKGDNRGHGLYSYQKIINGYPNITVMTSIQNNRFIQEIRILGDQTIITRD